jgi:hypothetical protein
MYIQYLGFDTDRSFRLYTFHVINPPSEAREFTVKVQSAAFGRNRLSLQDGPGICYARLGQALQGQTPESPADPCLIIGERDITDYLEHHHPKKG